jgi:hypothetical protein
MSSTNIDIVITVVGITLGLVAIRLAMQAHDITSKRALRHDRDPKKDGSIGGMMVRR